MKLIDKDALVAEIENIRKHYIERDDFDNGWNFALDKVLSLTNSLELKEVDLEKAAINYLLHEHISPLNEVFHQSDIKAEMQYHKDIENAFKMGFELGIKAQ